MASSWSGYGPSAPHSSQHQPSQQSTESGSSKKKQQPRQLLSCTKCRERKVKCDRTKPCSACCARGHPRECLFIVGEGNDYSAIKQSYEIRELRRENDKLRKRLDDADARRSVGDDDEDDGSPDRSNAKTASRVNAARQRRLRTNDRVDNIYFGTPGLANIVSDFANLQVGTHSLTHTVPKGQDMYPAEGTGYPFPMIPVGDNTPAALTSLLPKDEEIYQHLDLFQHCAQSCSFPHVPDEVTKKEVERFLQNKEDNAMKAPDMLGLIFATLAVGMQIGIYDRNGCQWLEAPMESSHRQSECYLTASMQCLRHASFMSQPTLLGIQALVMMGPYLTNSGRFLDAWTLFGTTIRLAHSIGLHRDPKLLDPVPPLRECMIRRTLWWWMLHMDQQYSVTLGRPLGISGIGDCPPPLPLTTNSTVLRLGEFVNHFTVHARQILSSDGLMSVAKIDEFTDKLLGLWDTMPETLQFNESWTRQETVLPEWPLDVMSATLFAKVQSFIILLNRQRDERTMRTAPSTSPPAYPNSLTGATSTTYNSAMDGDGILHQAPIRGRPLVINSSIHLLQTFIFFYYQHPAVLICWTLGQQAFNAAMIIILDAWETGNDQNMWLVDYALVVFTDLQRNRVHKLAELAVTRITKGIVNVRDRQQKAQDAAAAAAAAGISRRSSQQQQQQQHQHPQAQNINQSSPPVPAYHLYQPSLGLENPGSSLDFSGDTVMGNTGMFLLEDPGLQSTNPATQHFAPWSLSLPASAAGNSPHSSAGSPTAPPTTGYFSPPSVSVSNVPIAPFPVMSPSFQPPMVPMLASPFAVGLQPRMPTGARAQQGADPALAAQQQQFRQPPLQAQRRPSRNDFSPYAAQAAARGSVGQGQAHRVERPTSARSRSGRNR